jgi:hypothetical protein
MACITSCGKTIELGLTSWISSEYQKEHNDKASSYNRTRSRDGFEDAAWCGFSCCMRPMTTSSVAFLPEAVFALDFG